MPDFSIWSGAGSSNASAPCWSVTPDRHNRGGHTIDKQQETIMSNQLQFNDIKINIHHHDGDRWIASVDIANALGYKQSDSISKIY